LAMELVSPPAMAPPESPEAPEPPVRAGPPAAVAVPRMPELVADGLAVAAGAHGYALPG